MQFQVVISFVVDPLATTNLAGQTVPASCLFEDLRTGNRWVLASGPISEAHWAQATEYGTSGVVRPAPLGYVERTVFSDRAHRSGGVISIDDRWFIPCDELPLVPETQRPITGFAPFVHLHAHSEFSPLDGLATPDEMVQRAVALDQFAIAVTDHGYCAAHPQLQKSALAAGIKPIFGLEANLVRNRHLREDRYDYWHFLLLARNEVGLRNLWGASTEAHIEGFYGRPRMDFETMARFSEGLIGSTACLRGPLKQLVLAGDEQGAKEMISRLRAIFPESLYLEIHTNALPEQVELNRALVQLGKEMSLPLVAVCDAHYADDCDHHLHKAWIAAQTDKDLSADQDLFSGDEHYYLKSHIEVADALAYLGPDAVHEAMANTVDIARSCDVTIKQGSAKPVYHRYIAPGFEGSTGADRDIEVLRERVEAGFVLKRCAERDVELLRLRSEEVQVETYRERVERELDVMISKGFAGYFLVVEDYCLDPSTPVLTEDLRWVEVGKVQSGDRLLAFDEHGVVKRRKAHQYWRTAEVVSTQRLVLPTYRVALSDGTETITSSDHRWLITSPSGSARRWVKTSDLRVGQLAQRLVNEWNEPDTWDAGYIAGILDGEGWISHHEMHHGGRSLAIAFAQREGEVLSTTLRILDSWGFDYHLKHRSDGVGVVTIRGGRSEVLRLLGMARPKRLLAKMDVDLLGRVTAVAQPSIVSIDPLGLGEVIALETTTGTLVAQGFAHHNCSAARQGRTKANKKILMGPGRGSVVGSLVAYLIGITQVDPIEADLLFERFITAGRNSPPDIDLDFPSSERGAITDYLTERWGADRTVRVGTHGRLQNKSVFRSLEKVFRSTPEHAMEWTDLVEITKIIDAAEAHTAGLGLKWEDLWDQEGDLLEPYRVKYPLIFDYAERMIKRLQLYGRHPSGVVIDPEHPIVDRLPLRTAGDKDSRQVVTEFDQEALELLGYLKFDILTLRTLDTIQTCLDLIRDDEFYGGKLTVDIDTWVEEYNDPQVWDMLCAGDTLGVFQIETSSGTRLVKRMQPRSIADLSAILTLVRPGPMRSGLTDTYIKRRFGQEPVVAIHPLLEPVLGRTYQCMIYQEDIMAVCSTLAGYDLEQSDKVRAILGKKKVEEAAREGVRFIDRCVERGIERTLAEAVWAQMQEFAKYTFNRAHSWSYAVLAYWCAWLKCHFPAHFSVAVLSTIDKKRIPEFVEMTRRNGYEVLPPDINESSHGFTVSANRLGVRYGFGSISSIGEATSDAIIQGQPYTSWDDFIERRGAKCNIGHIRTLAGVGTFDALIPEGKTRPSLMAVIELIAAGKTQSCQWKIEGFNGPNGLPCTFDWSTEVTIGKSGKPLKAKPLPKQCTKACRQYVEREGGIPWPDLPGMTKKQVRDREREVLGVYLSSTPFDAVPLHVLDGRGIVYGEEFDTAPNGNYGVYAIINSIRIHEDKAGRKMAFVGINSLGFEHDVTVFSKAYQRYAKQLVKDTLCILDVDRNDRGLTLNHIFPIDQEQAALQST